MHIHPISRHELWTAQIALFVAISLQVAVWALNPSLTFGPHRLILTAEVALSVVIGLGASNRHRWSGKSYRRLSFLLLGLISAANISSCFLVGRMLIMGDHLLNGRQLILAAMAIFVTNIIVFALWYWEIDSPGLTGSRWSKHDKDLHFTEQGLGKDFSTWQASFVDYLYLSVTNAINFAPANANPITAQAKLLMGTQALVSVITLALIFARSVSILA